MSRSKQKAFLHNEEARNVIQPGKPHYEAMKGKWREFFGNDNELVLELACGYGEYTVGLGRIFPDRNFIGVDIKGARLCKGSKIAIEEKLDNVAFLRTLIHHLDNFFDRGEVDEIWITFPDPRPRDGDEKKRLTHPRFMELYKYVLKPGGKVHFKTDNRGLFDYSLEVIKEQGYNLECKTNDLYESAYANRHHGIKTRYEKKFTEEGFKINYLSFDMEV